MLGVTLFVAVTSKNGSKTVTLDDLTSIAASILLVLKCLHQQSNGVTDGNNLIWQQIAL